MRGSILAIAAVLSVSSAVAEETASLPFGPGSTLYWTSFYGGQADKLIERVVASGEDFEIYRTLGDYASGEMSDYFALFSGVDYRTCGEALATDEERAALQALWPLEPGKTATLTTLGDSPVTVRVDEPKAFFLMGRTWLAHIVVLEHEDEETEDEIMTVLDDPPMTVSFRWDETGLDTVTLVTRPVAEPDYELDEDTIGNCAQLLTE